MDRYEYRYNGSGHGHYAYNMRLNDREKVILEVGIENKVIRPDRPADLQNCNNVSINERMVRDINNGDLQVYIVRRANNGYNVSPVGIATYSQISPTFVGFTSVDHKFVYNFSQPAGDQNLSARSDMETSVYYRGVLSHTCPRQYLFERRKKRAGKSYSEFTLIPEIGITEEKTGFNKTDADNNRLVLISINGTPLDQYVKSFCTGKSMNYAHDGKFYSTRQYAGNAITGNVMNNDTRYPNGTVTTFPTTTTRPTTTNTPIFTSNCDIYKDLDRNLYVVKSTGQLANTECGGNRYINGRMVGSSSVPTTTRPSTGVVTTTTTPPATVPFNPQTNTPPVATNNTKPNPCGSYSGNGVHVVQLNETLYGISRLYGVSVGQLQSWNNLRGNMINPCQKLRTQPTSTVSPAAPQEDILVSRGENTGIHVVQRNETLYGIAQKYGYTTDKLRQMNSMSKNDIIMIGQRLKTTDCNCPAPAVANNNIPNTDNIPAAAEFITEKGIPDSFDYTGEKRDIYVVKENDTVYSIARQYNISVEQLRTLNDLEENEIIIPYQRLYIQ